MQFIFIIIYFSPFISEKGVLPSHPLSMLRLGKDDSRVAAEDRVILPNTIKSPRRRFLSSSSSSTCTAASSPPTSSNEDSESESNKKETSKDTDKPITQLPLYEDFMLEPEGDLEQAVGKILEKYLKSKELGGGAAAAAAAAASSGSDDADGQQPPSNKKTKLEPRTSPPAPPPSSKSKSGKSKSGGPSTSAASSAEKKTLAKVKKTIAILHKSLEGL